MSPQDLDMYFAGISGSAKGHWAIDPNTLDLRVETLVPNLEHSQKTISKLKSALLKMKMENAEHSVVSESFVSKKYPLKVLKAPSTKI